jgi:hypothetical protein
MKKDREPRYLCDSCNEFDYGSRSPYFLAHELRVRKNGKTACQDCATSDWSKLDMFIPEQDKKIKSLEDRIESLRKMLTVEAISKAANLGDAYYCNRSWEAWSYGTMSEMDFDEIDPDGFAEELIAELKKEAKP